MKLKRIYQYITVVSLSFFWVLSLPLAWGEPVTTIRDNGDSANRVDFVILGDGYTASELTKYANDVENAVNGFFNQEPFREYQNYFNVHRVDVISNESGVDHPPDVYKDTAFDTGFSGRIIFFNQSKVNTVLSNSVNPDQRDMSLVLVNDTTYGGAGGGTTAYASTNSACIELVLHEVGHSFGLLGDEYVHSSCTPTVEPSQVNRTIETSRDLIKWNIGGGPPTGWIDLSTPIPTLSTTNSIPGLYEGAGCSSGVYRSTYNSKMRSLGPPFEQINEEQLIKRVYNWVSPMDSSSPSESEVTLQADEVQLFQVDVLEPLTHSLDIEWYVDDQYQSNSLQFSFDSNSFEQGVHTIEVVIWDSTSKVRYDPANVLTEQRSWTVSVMPSCDIDSDDDGTTDCNDNCPNDPNKTEPGICGCGIADTDTDLDGTPDCNDNCLNDPGKTEPGVCGCGIADTDSDSDGTPDCNDNCENDPNKIEPGICGCGVPDTDSDSDSTLDCNDNCPSDPNKIEPGICGCGIADTDSDGDEIPDCIDGCNQDPDKTNPGVCGCGVPDTDSDEDGMVDCWEEDYGLNPSVDDANDDLDGDGWSNIMEYMRGTDPTDPNSHPSKAMPWIPLLLLDD